MLVLCANERVCSHATARSHRTLEKQRQMEPHAKIRRNQARGLTELQEPITTPRTPRNGFARLPELITTAAARKKKRKKKEEPVGDSREPGFPLCAYELFDGRQDHGVCDPWPLQDLFANLGRGCILALLLLNLFYFLPGFRSPVPGLYLGGTLVVQFLLFLLVADAVVGC